MIFVLLGAAAVTSMTAVKHMQQRTKKEQNVRQGAKQMRFMLFPKKKQSDRGKP